MVEGILVFESDLAGHVLFLITLVDSASTVSIVRTDPYPDVVNRSGILDPQRPWHPANLQKTTRIPQYLELTPSASPFALLSPRCLLLKFTVF
jgi:hypothetical protein